MPPNLELLRSKFYVQTSKFKVPTSLAFGLRGTEQELQVVVSRNLRMSTSPVQDFRPRRRIADRELVPDGVGPTLYCHSADQPEQNPLTITTS